MRALQATSLEGPDDLVEAEVPAPSDQRLVVIEVHSAGVSFADTLALRGRYQLRADPPFVPGMEVAGVVRSAPGHCGLRQGDRVASFVRCGAWAEVVAAEPRYTFRLPEGLGFDDAVALTLNYRTACFGLLRRGGLRPGETVLVHGAGGGVGSAAVEIAKAVGARVVATAMGAAKREAAARAGADRVLDAAAPWLGPLRQLTEGRGVDAVFDPVGGDRFGDSVRALAPGGRLLVVGFAGGAIPTLAMNRLLLRNAAAVGVAFPEFADHEPAMPAAVADRVLELWGQGLLRPRIGGRYPLERAADAVREIEARRAVGKLVLALR